MTKENSWLNVWLSCFQALLHLLLSCAQPRRGASIITQLCSFLWCICFSVFFRQFHSLLQWFQKLQFLILSDGHISLSYTSYTHREVFTLRLQELLPTVKALQLGCSSAYVFFFSPILPFEQELLYKKLLFSAPFETPVDSLAWMYHTHLLPPAFNELVIWLFQPFVPQLLLTYHFLRCSKGHKRSTQKSQISSQFWSCLVLARAEVAFTASPWQHACSLAPCRLGSRGPLVYSQTKFT